MFSNLNALIGKVSFTDDQFINNFDTFMKTIDSKRSERFKGKYYLKVYLKSSNGPSFRLHPQFVDPRDDNYFMNSIKKYKKFDIRSTLEVKELNSSNANQENVNTDAKAEVFS